MSTVWTLVKRELGAYFTSPVAYEFLVIFLLLAGFFTFTAGSFFERGEASLAAFFGWHLRGDASMRDYLTAAPGGAGRKPGDPPGGLKGFKPGTDRGVRVEGKRD